MPIGQRGLRAHDTVLRGGKRISDQSGREMGLLNMDFLYQNLTSDLFNNEMIDPNLLSHEYANITSEPEEPEYEEPKTFKAAYHHEDPVQREQWREAIRKELKDMKARNVWTKIKKNTVPKNRRFSKNNQIFKIKKNGKFKARLVACGYS